jgi:arginyl-tRNA synthetase
VDRIEIAGPGFINFYLKANWVSELLAAMVAAGKDYGNLHQEHPEKVQIEFVSANPTGPLHVGPRPWCSGR